MTQTPPRGTLLGFDFGLRRIGVATGQGITATANPLTILPARDGQPDWTDTAALVREWRPTALVVGLPLNADGSDSDLTPRARRFARRLQGRFGLPVYMIDERLSSRAAAEIRPGRQALDDLAAARILQDWLEAPAASIRLGEENDGDKTPS